MKSRRAFVPNQSQVINFEDVFHYIENNPNIINYSVNSNFISKISFRTGKVTKQIINFVKSPETKAAVLIANWAATATLLLMLIISASSIATIAITTFLLVVETYAVFGNVEYTLAYAQAKKMFIPS